MISSSPGSPCLPMGLDQSVQGTIGLWVFEPATLEGRPVAVYHNMTSYFTLA